MKETEDSAKNTSKEYQPSQIEPLENGNTIIKIFRDRELKMSKHHMR